MNETAVLSDHQFLSQQVVSDCLGKWKCLFYPPLIAAYIHINLAPQGPRSLRSHCTRTRENQQIAQRLIRGPNNFISISDRLAKVLIQNWLIIGSHSDLSNLFWLILWKNLDLFNHLGVKEKYLYKVEVFLPVDFDVDFEYRTRPWFRDWRESLISAKVSQFFKF